MDLVSVIPSSPHTKISSNCFSFPSQEGKLPYILPLKTSSFPQRLNESFGTQSIIKAYIHQTISENKKLLPVACSSFDNSGGSEKDDRAVEAVLKLYRAIRHKNLEEISDIIGEECRCISNFVCTFQPFHGKKQVLDFFSSLIKSLGNNIEFVVQPSEHNGMDVGISWKLEYKKTHAPLGKGFSFYMCHLYQGKVVIRNVEMFLEPLLHIEPLRLKMMSLMMNAMEKMNTQVLVRDKTERTLKILCAVLCIAALLFFLVNSRCASRNRKKFEI